MRRRRIKNDLYILIFLMLLLLSYCIYNHVSSESRGIKAYNLALDDYKKSDYEKAYAMFAKVPTGSTLKEAALFRQARCATNMGKKELAIRKYKKVTRSRSKSSIIAISEYNMAYLLYELKDSKANKHFKNIIKKYPTSDYSIASEYYLGLIELENSKIQKNKSNEQKIQNAFNYFKTYIEKSPDGRYSLKAIDEIEKLNIKLKNYDNLIIAKAYYANGEYEKARQYLNKTTLSESWTDFAKTENKLGNKDKVRYYTELGLEKYSSSVNLDEIYNVIDNYINTFDNKKTGINNLLAKNYQDNGADYISYLNCSEVVSSRNKEACYRTLYEKYPNGRFSADSLYNIFISKYLDKKYSDAQRLGYLHLKKFPNVKSTPAVTYYMGKISGKLKHYDVANQYYKKTLELYPDTYYAYRANYQLYKADGALPFSNLNNKRVVFPYKKSIESNLVVKLAHLKDYDLVGELCNKDKFIQSWIAYEKGYYTISSILARNAMEELQNKPSFDDLRWRLIYPLHYFEDIEKSKRSNNPIILQSILKEESHFNQYAISHAGASGLMQLMPATYSELNSQYNIGEDIFLPTNNIKAASLYYEKLKAGLDNKDLYAISAYNGGVGSVRLWFKRLIYSDVDEFVEQIPYPETKNYIKKIFRTYWVYGNIYI